MCTLKSCLNLHLIYDKIKLRRKVITLRRGELAFGLQENYTCLKENVTKYSIHCFCRCTWMLGNRKYVTYYYNCFHKHCGCDYQSCLIFLETWAIIGMGAKAPFFLAHLYYTTYLKICDVLLCVYHREVKRIYSFSISSYTYQYHKGEPF